MQGAAGPVPALLTGLSLMPPSLQTSFGPGIDQELKSGVARARTGEARLKLPAFCTIKPPSWGDLA